MPAKFTYRVILRKANELQEHANKSLELALELADMAKEHMDDKEDDDDSMGDELSKGSKAAKLAIVNIKKARKK